MATILQMIASLDAGSMTRTVTEMQGMADKLGKTLGSYNAKVDDKSAQASILKMQIQADKLQDKLKAKMSIDGTQKAGIELLGLEARAEALQKKLDFKVKVDVVDKSGKSLLDRIRSGGSGGIAGLKNLFGSSGGGAASGASSSLFSTLGGAAGPTGLGLLAALGLATGPAVLPVALGGGLGGLGALLTGSTKIKKDFADLLSSIRADVAPLKPLFDSVFNGLEKFVANKQVGAALRDVFTYSIPYLKMFVGFLEQATKIFLPSFSMLLRNMVPFLPQIEQGLLRIVKGFAGMFAAMGPQGMADATKIFVTLTKVIEFALVALGKIMNALAVGIIKGVHDIATWWDWFAHHTANVFDGIRHNLASWWDDVWNHSFKPVISVATDIIDAFRAAQKFLEAWALRLEIVFAGWAKNILHYAQDAFGWLPSWLPGVSGIKKGLSAAESDLAHFVSAAQAKLHELTAKPYTVNMGVAIPGSKNFVPGATQGHKVIPGMASGGTARPGWSWVGERGPELAYFRGGETVIPNHAIGGYAAGTGAVTVHLSTPSMNAMTSLFSSAISAIVGKFGARAAAAGYPGAVPGGGAPAANAALARRMYPPWAGGAEWSAWNAVAMRESGWNQYARNPSGAYGIPQALPASKMGPAANPPTSNPGAQIAWMISYIKSTYGDPIGAWAHELSAGWYDRGGWLKPGLTLAYNGTGRPERVTPGSGATVNINGGLHLHNATDMALVNQKINFATIAAGMGVGG